MHGTHGIFDHVLFAILVLAPLIEWRWTWPGSWRDMASGAAGVRLRFYRGLIVEEWLAALCLLGFWAWAKRPWAGLPRPRTPSRRRAASHSSTIRPR